MAKQSPALITAVEVEELFGRQSYEVALGGVKDPDSRQERLSLIYGNNGSGKTTILKLIWHTLSPSDSNGHRTALSRIPFKSFAVHLANGDVVRIVKLDGLYGSFIAQVWSDGKPKLEQYYYADSGSGKVIAIQHEAEAGDRGQIEIKLDISPEMWRSTDEYIRSERERQRNLEVHSRRRRSKSDPFISYLAGINASPYLLADDRQIYGDKISRPRDMDVWRYEGVHEPSGIKFREEGDDEKGVSAELTTAISRVNAMIQNQALTGSVKGSRSSNDAYLGILRRVASTGVTKADEQTRSDLINRIENLADQTLEFSKYGILPEIDCEMFVSAINAVPAEKISVVEDVIAPFIDAQNARLAALVNTVDLVRTFTNEMNRFFRSSGKEVTYQRERGIEVRFTSEGRTSPPGPVQAPRRRGGNSRRLSPQQLSSGERQVLLLLLNTVLARENTRVFLIDEPELSLNVKWQRQLMDALLACTDGSSVQFIVATHSIEVVTGHRASLARMIPKGYSADADY